MKFIQDSIYQPQMTMRRISVFTTNIGYVKDVATVIEALNKVYPEFKVNVDMEDCDRILRVESQNEIIDAIEIIKIVKEKGFECGVLDD